MITNKEIKLLKSLSQKKYRYKYKQFLIEGLRIVEELIRSNHKPLKIWTTEEVLNKNAEFKKNITKFDHEVISQKYFSQTLDTQNPQHIMALLSIDSKDVLRLVGQNILVLDGVSVTYMPNANFNGTDSFTFIANDGEFNSNEATVALTVNAVNDAPYLLDIPNAQIESSSVFTYILRSIILHISALKSEKIPSIITI